ncbi:hypothetical protein COT77_03275 [Candidatus Berkelbacteria bacterium CG10_big_fil_rev_8_21_14_0_10_41_12]|uniref:Carbohydrate-binding domain-containing protein n=1 Tax=Candidatus Berkelbacteria bacterium CG10_big_fil_rev_8_21_14_0_10_41_12 TaxID=1974513 RepID=A0A2M6WWF2_9BACT|nr:MAG: hypothetical protein COT77_03275 [Candidatus Berkelbacteria bacterium CG10_big_fil_rev_8_21_14_0_10_41_12]
MNTYLVKQTASDKLDNLDWSQAKEIDLVDATNGLKIKKSAKFRLLWSPRYLYIFFDVTDDHIWGTHKRDDDPIYDEEAVEVFLAFGKSVPKEYFELQFSPNGVKYDAWVKNPTGNRCDKQFNVDVNWNFKNIEFNQEIDASGNPRKGTWTTYIKIPATEIKGSNFKAGDALRGNFYRIDGWPKQNSFQAWSPTMKSPPDFHVPQKFGIIYLR